MIIREQSLFASLFSKSWVSVLLTILVTVLMFGFLIFIHELGHYLTARLCKVSIREFSIGMGPKIYGRVSKKTGILYSLRALPIGGYVAMEGEDTESQDPNAFHKKKVWQRMLITVAGGFMNLLLGVILTFVYVLTFPKYYGNTVVDYPEFSYSNQCTEPLQIGDEILSIDGHSVRTGQEIVYELFRAGGDKKKVYTDEEAEKVMMKVDLTVLRNGEKIVLHDVVFPVGKDEGVSYGLRDFYYNAEAKSLSSTFKNVGRQMRLNVKMVYESLFDLLRGRYGLNQISGPVGTAGVVGEALKNDATVSEGQSRNSFLYLFMIISVNLGLFNLLPIPALDGGRLFFQLIELIFRKPVPLKYEGMIHTVGLLLLLLLMAVITFKDIFGIFT